MPDFDRVSSLLWVVRTTSVATVQQQSHITFVWTTNMRVRTLQHVFVLCVRYHWRACVLVPASLACSICVLEPQVLVLCLSFPA